MNNRISTSCDVAIIGGGPAGLAAAITLKKGGVDQVVVIEREKDAGGIPRHCGHPVFGFTQYHRILSGPDYAKRTVQAAQEKGVQIKLHTAVTALKEGGKLITVSPDGCKHWQARRVLLTTGTREKSRSARMVSGERPIGIYNTGALQSMVYLKGVLPFRRPIVVGTELVALSALYTCKKAGIKPVAVLEEQPKPSVGRPLQYTIPFFGVSLLLQTKITRIYGKERVEGVRVSNVNQIERTIACDGILFTGQFVPEASLASMSHLSVNTKTGAPLIDPDGRCSDPSYYAAGNILTPVKTAGTCWKNGCDIAKKILIDLKNNNF